MQFLTHLEVHVHKLAIFLNSFNSHQHDLREFMIGFQAPTLLHGLNNNPLMVVLSLHHIVLNSLP